MAEIKSFKNGILASGLVASVIIEMISLPVMGFNVYFALGLGIGTAVSEVGFILLTAMGQLLVASKKKTVIILNYPVKLFICGLSFLLCIKNNFVCGLGCAIGFTTVSLGIMLLYGIVYGVFSKKKNPLNNWTEPKQWNDLSIYDEEWRQ